MGRVSVLRRSLIALTLVAAATAPVFAAGPSIIMIYGDGLPQPMFVVPHSLADMGRYASLWCGSGGSSVPADELAGRQSLRLAIFWIAEAWTDAAAAERLTKTLRPEDAAQHGRLYLPAGERPALTIVTALPRRPGQTLEDQERRPVPSAEGEFVRACPVTRADLASARLGLNPVVPAADPAKYRDVRDAKDWRNPWISVRPDGVEVVSGALPGGRKLVSASELRALLVALPASAWPYGRVIAASDPGPRDVGRDDDPIRRNHQLVDRLSEILDIKVDWWPPA